ncbi:MAG TPA: ABC transporter ATP-binding protein [Pyrinomonadaceae bacterium]|jgi:ABC-2 type transport system ATP-binding protein|nr:ABC transporter ATP-binding protein [Pyrinomonadaceae bacterium]
MVSTFGLSKYYETTPAVRDVDLYVSRGEICGLIGPNGAGKTTLLKMLAGLLRPTSGKIEVDRIEVGAEPKRLHEIVGYVPDTFGLYDELSVRQFLEYFARAHNVASDKVRKRIASVLELTNLSSKLEAAVGSLSRGMRQRLVIAKTLLHAPKVLLLDEPASGLDPLARIELRDLIRELGRMGTTLVVSSHILTELADFCTSVVIMEQGHVIRSGRVDELIETIRGGTPLRIELVDEAAARALAATLSGRDDLKNLSVNRLTIDCAFQGDRAALAELHREVVLANASVVSFYERRLTIEDVFMAVGSHKVS